MRLTRAPILGARLRLDVQACAGRRAVRAGLGVSIVACLGPLPGTAANTIRNQQRQHTFGLVRAAALVTRGPR
jgi:hypothetical protein